MPDVTVVAPGDDWEIVEATRALVDTPGTCYLGDVRRAAAALAPTGIAPTIVSLHTLKPIDVGLICSLAREHAALLTVEEHVLTGGLGGAVAEVLADAGAFPARFRRLGIANRFVWEVGSREYRRRVIGIDAAAIATAIRALVS